MLQELKQINWDMELMVCHIGPLYYPYIKYGHDSPLQRHEWFIASPTLMGGVEQYSTTQ